MRTWLKLLPCLVGILAGAGYITLQASEWTVSRQDGQPAPDSSVFPAMSSSTNIGAAIVISSSPFFNDGGSNRWAGVVYGLHLSSVSAQSFVILRDSDTANTTSPVLTAIQQPQLSTQSAVVQFNPPLRFRHGLVANAGSCDSRTAAGGVCYTVLYDVK